MAISDEELTTGRRPRTRVLWLAVPLLAALALLAVLRLPLAAATITVANGAVAVNDNGVCSLIEALENANDTTTGQPYDDCAAGDPSGPDTVSLADNGTYSLTQVYESMPLSFLAVDLGLPAIDTTVTIDGNMAEVYRDSSDPDSFSILGVLPDGELTVQDVWLRGGDSVAGGAIASAGAVTVTGSVLTDSYGDFGGGAIACMGGSLDVSDSWLLYNLGEVGGAILSVECDAVVTDSFMAINQALFGGATAVFSGTLDLERDTTLVNLAYGYCGAHVLSGPGGAASVVNSSAIDPYGFALCAITGTMTVDNSTIAEGDDPIFGDVPYGGIVAGTTFDFPTIAPAGAGIVPAFDASQLALSALGESPWAIDVPADFPREVPAHWGQSGAVFGRLSAATGASSAPAAGGAIDAPAMPLPATPVVTPLITVTQSIVSGYEGGDMPEIAAEIEGQIVSGGHNVLGNDAETTAFAFVNFTPDPTDFVGTSDAENIPHADILDLLYTEVGTMFGEGTLYYAPAPNSPAIDFAPSANCLASDPVDGVDQISNPRNVDYPTVDNGPAYLCDAGAIEEQVSELTVYVAAKAGTADNDTESDVVYTDGDVLEWDGEAWTKWFDGTDNGVNATADIITLDVDNPGTGSFYLSWRQTQVILGFGKVLPQEIIYYDGGSFNRFFDGRDVGLTLVSERPNGIEVLDGGESPIGSGCNAYLLISTMAGGKVRNGTDPIISFTGEDVLGFCMTQSGTDTEGEWHLAFEGQSNGLPKNSTLGFAATEDADTLYFTTKGTYPPGVNNVLPFAQPAGPLGASEFDATAAGLPKLVDSIDFVELVLPPDPCRTGDLASSADC